MAENAQQHSRKRQQAHDCHKPGILDVDESMQDKTPASTFTTTPANVAGSVLTVGDVASHYAILPSCSAGLSIGDVADLLISSDHTAATVVNNEGIPQGVITEDDILQGYLSGVPRNVTVAEWLHIGSDSGLESGVVFAGMSVGPEQLLQHVAPVFWTPSLAAPGSHSIVLGHLLVRGAFGSYGGGIFSPLDLARAIANRGWQGELAESLGLEVSATVADLMEPLDNMPALAPGSTVLQLLREILESPARVALMFDDQGVRSLATIPDLLWAFSRQICLSQNACKILSSRPGQIGLDRRSIPSYASLQAAATAMLSIASRHEQGCSNSVHLRSLVAVEPSGEVVGVISPAHLARGHSAEVLPAWPSQPSAPPMMLADDEQETDVRQSSVQQHQQNMFRPHHVTVADITAQRETATCFILDTLGDAADALVASGRTGAVVLDWRGDVRGVLTENDLLAALAEGTPWDCSIDKWLRRGDARLPGFMVPALTLPATTTLVGAAAKMASIADEHVGCACHHLLVHAGGGDIEGGIGVRLAQRTDRSPRFCLLSALDIATGMIDAAAAKAAGALGGDELAAAVEAASMTVEQAMKDRGNVASCTLDDTLAKAFRVMCESQQNCVLVVAPGALAGKLKAQIMKQAERSDGLPEPEQEQGGVRIFGIITAADALRAFSEKLRGHSTSLSGWLRGLTDAERVSAAQRSIESSALLANAATAMFNSGVHHLVVVRPGGTEVIGVLSALDIVCALDAVYRFAVTSPRGVKQSSHAAMA